MNLMIVTYDLLLWSQSWHHGKFFFIRADMTNWRQENGSGLFWKNKNKKTLINTFLNVMNDKTEYNAQRDMNAWAI